jgi:putative acetyltransferase
LRQVDCKPEEKRFLKIRRSAEPDRTAISDIHMDAFGQEEGPEIVELVNDLLDDPTAQPLLSLVAESGKSLVGHILFTAVKLQPHPEISAQILAPLAVCTEVQNTGVGGKLIREGLKQLTETGVGLVFVLGHPGYYPKLGFRPAGVLGYEAPYPIAAKNADAWMVQALREGLIGSIDGRVQCSDSLNQPRLWRE